MTYFPPVRKEDFLKAVGNYKRFLVVSILILSAVVATMFKFYIEFWEGNLFWGTGSLVIFFSLVSAKFFDIHKNANPGNRRVDFINMKNNSPREHRIIQRWLTIQEIIHYSWILGFALVASSRWISI